MDVIVRALEPRAGAVEVVERKGIGHPDTICDGIAEHLCARLCRHYRQRFGAILHHNVDKVLLVGGGARAAFGGGEILQPIEIYLAGRVTGDVEELAVESAREWLRAHLGHVDVERGVRIIPRLRAGSRDLTTLFRRESLANDTSCGAGFAPLTELERVVLAVERRLNAPETKRRHPEIGEDVKVMGVRRDARIALTVGCAFVARHLRDLDDYADKKTRAVALAADAARSVTGYDVDVAMNVADDPARGDVYLTVSGTSAEAGDDGEVGRGNRVSGLITPYRPMTLEAAAGKNPVTHVGKLYNVLAHRIAAAIEGVTSATCVLVSQIGRPVRAPQLADVCVDAEITDALRAHVGQTVHRELEGLDALREDLIAERIAVY
jgi:S-adenosylmethionine synthetase